MDALTNLVATFSVPDLPVPQGSKSAWRGRVIESNPKLRPWRRMITDEAKNFRGPFQIGPVSVHLMFSFPRLVSHWRSGRFSGQLKPNAPYWKFTEPDVDKLARSVLDSITLAGTIWRDDAQVSSLICDKKFGDQPGVDIVIWVPQTPCRTMAQTALREDHSS